MKAEYVNPFIQGTIVVFKELLKEEIIRGRTLLADNPAPGQEIAVVLSVTGSVKGQVVYSMNRETVFKIVGKLMPGADRAAIEKEYRDVLGELGNMITGSAVNLLDASEHDLDLSVPYVVETKSNTLQIIEKKTLRAYLFCRMGMLEISIALSQD